MPFLGQDWRSPGQSWVKTEEGWKKTTADDKNNNVSVERLVKNTSHNTSFFSKCATLNCAITLFPFLSFLKKIIERKKVQTNFHREKWIYVHKGSTKERHGYCTLGEAFNRLDFCSAIKDTRRFNYVVRLLELIAKSQLPSLSGVAQKNYMNILERIVQKVLDDQQNVRPIKELLQTLYISLCGLVQDMGKSVLVGNINMWVHRMENILQWQQQLDSIQINRPTSTGMSLTDLPASLQLNIMERLSDGRDLVSLGQVCPELGSLTEDRLLWKRLCQYHFTDRQRLMVSDKGHLEWKKMYFKLSRCYPHREQYSDTLHFCSHCHILFWKDTDHPCTANNPESCTASLSPQDFINLFNF
uniref:F-box only protein 32 n=1 Tax=Stegastes partitus TaxID=144197 RepID=A0A3B5B620_9TELE